MFYSTDLLTRRRGYAVYWLAATLSSRGTWFRKLTKKEIIACNLVTPLLTTCIATYGSEKLAHPEEPLALRLSSNLLCGIARVFSQQYAIYQADVVAFQQTVKRALDDFNKGPPPGPGAHAELDVSAAPSTAVQTNITFLAPEDNLKQLPTGFGCQEDWDPALMILDMSEAPAQPTAGGDQVEGWDAASSGQPSALDVQLDALLSPQGGTGAAGPSRQGPRESSLGSAVGRGARDAVQVADEAEISLREPQIDDFLQQQYVAQRGVEGFMTSEDFAAAAEDYGEGGLLMGVSAEVDAAIQAASRGGGSSSGAGWPQGPAASSSGGGVGMIADRNADLDGMGGFDYADGGFDNARDGFYGGLDDALADRDTGWQATEQQAEDAAAAEPASEAGAGEQLSPLTPLSNLTNTSLKSALKRPLPRDVDDDEVETQPAKRQRKKRKTIVLDPVTSLSLEQISTSKQDYATTLTQLREKADYQQWEKEETARALELVQGPSSLFAGELKNFWNQVVGPDGGERNFTRSTAARSGLSPAASAPARETTPEGRGPGSADGFQQEKDQLLWDDGGGYVYDDPYGGLDDALAAEGRDRELDVFAEVEQGRGEGGEEARGSQRSSILPWNIEEGADKDDIFMGYMAGSSHTGGTAQKISLDTPVDIRQRHSHTGSAVPSLPGELSPTARLVGGADDDQGMARLDSEDVPAFNEPDTKAADAGLEKESTRFLSFVKRKAAQNPDLLLFSDIVPVADTAPNVAAAAFSHVLTLASKTILRCEQQTAYGPIQITVN